MIEVTATIHVKGLPEEVFEFWSDWSNNPQWQSGRESCTWTSEPPLRLGSTYDQEASFLGQSIISSFEVVEYEPGTKLRMTTTERTLPLDITREVSPGPDGGTTLHATIRGGPTGLMRIFDPLMRRMVDKNVRKDHQRLKQLLRRQRHLR